MTAAYLINRTPTPLLAGKTPFERLYGRPPPLTHLRVFGCLCYAHNQHHKGDKFATRSIKGIFLGYPYGKKGWRVLNPITGNIFSSRDVVFCESDFPYATVTSPASSPPIVITESLPGPEEISAPTTYVSPLLPAQDSSSQSPLTSVLDNIDSTPDIETEGDLPSLPTDLPDITPSSAPVPETEIVLPLPETEPLIETEPLNTSSENQVEQSSPEELGRGLRTKNIPAKLHDYVLQTISPVVTCSTDAPYAIEFYVDCSNFSDNHCHFLAAISSMVEPKSYRQVVLDEFWRESIMVEYVALEDSGTWTVVDLPPGKHALGCKWVFKLKFRADGTLERRKSRLVVLGNNQVEGDDYE